MSPYVYGQNHKTMSCIAFRRRVRKQRSQVRCVVNMLRKEKIRSKYDDWVFLFRKNWSHYRNLMADWDTLA